MFTITIGKADTSCPDKITLTSGMVNAVQVAFAFSEEWEGFDKIAVFSNGATTVDVTLDEKDRCYVPHEVLSVAGRDVNVGVYGSKGEGEDYVAIPTEKCSLGKVSEGVDPSGEESAEPTPTIWDDLNIRVTNLESRMGEHTHETANYEYVEYKLKEEDLETNNNTTTCTINTNNNTISLIGYCKVKYNGYAEITMKISDSMGYDLTISIDGNEIYSGIATIGETYSYKGVITDGITINGNMVTLQFTEFKTDEVIGNDGFMSGEDKAKLDALSKSVGDIDTALDELHSYAQGLISGGASE